VKGVYLYTRFCGHGRRECGVDGGKVSGLGCLYSNGGENCGTGTIDTKARYVFEGSPENHWPSVLFRLTDKVLSTIGWQTPPPPSEIWHLTATSLRFHVLGILSISPHLPSLGNRQFIPKRISVQISAQKSSNSTSILIVYSEYGCYNSTGRCVRIM